MKSLFQAPVRPGLVGVQLAATAIPNPLLGFLDGASAGVPGINPTDTWGSTVHPHGSHPAVHRCPRFTREIDALVETGPDIFQAVEIKPGETIASDFFSGLDYWRGKLPRQILTPWLVHGGTAPEQRERATVLPWNKLGPLLEQLE